MAVANDATETLWRPTGPRELALLEESGWREWPPRLPTNRSSTRVLNREYAIKIARDWNVKYNGAGYVRRFAVRRDFIDRYEAHQVGGRGNPRVLDPAGDLVDLNANIVGHIEVTDEFG